MIDDAKFGSDDGIDDAINDAEEVHDPLAGLVEKTAKDPGAPFEKEVLKALAALKKSARAAFETLRAQLKDAGCRVTALDEAIAEESGDTGGRGPTQADILIDIAQTAQLFHTPDGVGFADIDVNGHRETWSVREEGFKSWLTRRFFEMTEGAPGSEAMQQALGVIEANARFKGPLRDVHIRVAGHEGRLYLDLADEDWRAVEIDATGWRVVNSPPVRFRRARGMKPLPVPVPGGSIDALRRSVNVKSDDDFVLAISFLLSCFRDKGPYPALVVAGEQGSAKSTFSAILRALIDPNVAPLRALPRDVSDLVIAAHNGRVLAFDNMSSLPIWVSDALCRVLTGGGLSRRKLYTDTDETLLNVTRPVILNGIESIVNRADLADRSLILTLEAIADKDRQLEEDLWRAFEAERPGILGALLDAVAHGLAQFPHLRLVRSPRMADFARWATACETAVWRSGTFAAAYERNRGNVVEEVLAADAVASAVRELIARRHQWEGTATGLLATLERNIDNERITKARTWPRDATRLSNRLRRAAPNLRRIGIQIDFDDRNARQRIIKITESEDREGQTASSASSASSSSAEHDASDASDAETRTHSKNNAPPPHDDGDMGAPEDFTDIIV